MRKPEPTLSTGYADRRDPGKRRAGADLVMPAPSSGPPLCQGVTTQGPVLSRRVGSDARVKCR